MLRITAKKGGSGAAYYYTRDDAGRKADGLWLGQLADRMGLTGAVDHEAFSALAGNIDPRTGKRWTARDDGGKRVALYDLTFLDPKSFTILRQVAGDDRLEVARREAVADVAAAIEADMTVRGRKLGKWESVVTGNMVAAAWFHETSRPLKEDGRPDPMGHVHLTILNGTEAGGKVRSPNLRYNANEYYATHYAASLAEKTAALGYGIRTKGKYWEVAGVGDATIRKFSRRHEEVVEYQEKHNLTGKRASQAGAASRSKKRPAELEDLKAYWVGKLTAGEKQGLLALKEKALEGRQVRQEEVTIPEARKAWQFVRDVKTAKRLPVAEVTQKDVASKMMRDFYGKAKPEQVLDAIKASGLKSRVKNGVEWLSKPSRRETMLAGMRDRAKRVFYERIRQSRVEIPQPAQSIKRGIRR